MYSFSLSQPKQDYSQFAPALNSTEYDWYITLISVFKKQCESYNITYILRGGSALGAYKYHGFVPWDDDFDLIVNSSHKTVLKKVLESVPDHSLLSWEYWQWKFWSNNNSVQTGRMWNWPFIDIYFFEDNGTHITDVTYKEPTTFAPRTYVLPVQLGIFENMILPVPRNVNAYLSGFYDIKDTCISNWWNHRDEKPPKHLNMVIPCKMLHHIYPVVYRYQSNGLPYEELRLQNTILYRIQHPKMI